MERTPRRLLLVAAVAAAGVATAFASILVLRRRRDRKLQQLKVRIEKQLSVQRLTLVNDLSQWQAVEKELVGFVHSHPVVGFDCEWVTVEGKARKVAMLQLATSDGWCILVRLNLLGVLPKSLIAILLDRRILKLGVGIQDDCKRIREDYGAGVRGFVDLRFVTYGHRPQLRKTGLAGLASAFLGLQLDKDWRIRAGNWEEEELSQRQILYAANDALVAVNIGLALVSEEMLKSNSLSPGWLRSGHEDEFVSKLWDICKPFREASFKAKVVRDATHIKSKKQRPFAEQGHVGGNSDSNKSSRKNIPERKSPLYQNAMLQAPDGQPLCVTDIKKAEWYIAKGLGTKVQDEPVTVRLNFEPEGRPEGAAGEYYLTFKENVCVVCGFTESYSRKYIVPHEYRKHFPDVMRDHQSHDILLLCHDCHKQSNLLEIDLRRRLAEECDAPIGTEEDVKVREDPDLREVRSASRALMRSKEEGGIPRERLNELEAVLKDYYQVEVLSDEILAKGANMETRIVSNNYRPHAFKVVEHYKQSGGIILLEKLWREHFLNSMKPRFLPPLWSVDHQRERLDIKVAGNRMSEADYKIANGSVSKEVVESP